MSRPEIRRHQAKKRIAPSAVEPGVEAVNGRNFDEAIDTAKKRKGVQPLNRNALGNKGTTTAPVSPRALRFNKERKMNVTPLKAWQVKADRQRKKTAVLDAWDRLFPKEQAVQQIGKQSRLDIDADVRRKAKAAL